MVYLPCGIRPCKYCRPRWGWRLELKLADMWLGVFWKRHTPGRFELWICLLPCLPIHIWRA